MAGHSKWKKIKNQKGVADQKRGALFSKLGRSITMAARNGSDPEMNFSLRLAIDKAKAANMPKDNIERAVIKGSGGGGSDQLTSVLFEVLAVGGVAILIEAVTDNNNRTFSELRQICLKNDASMDAKVLWQFERRGVIRCVFNGADWEGLELLLIDNGAVNYELDAQDLQVEVSVADMQKMSELLRQNGVHIESAELEYVPRQRVSLNADSEQIFLRLLEAIEEHDDVDNVYHNAE
jgi:YebC/PmpR family DNA-binding regulatory protein